MAIKLKSVRVDIKKEREGDWQRSPRFDGVRYLLKSINAPEYQAALSSVLRRLADSAKISDKEIDQDALHRARAGLVLDHILLDWSGFDVPYSHEIAREELTSLEARPLLDDILAAAELVGKLQVERIEDAAKN